jgi:hypothetical protein
MYYSLATSDYHWWIYFQLVPSGSFASLYFQFEKKKFNLPDTFGRVEHLQYQGQDQH